jgi:hypothetical protein
MSTGPVLSESRLIAYLLGRLRDEESQALEEAYIADEALREELTATGDDLIHAYLAGTLSAEDRERFETHFLAAPAQRERLEFMRLLLARVHAAGTGAVTGAKARPLSWGPWLLLAACLTVLVGGLVLWQWPQANTHVAANPSPSASPSPTAAETSTPAVVEPAPVPMAAPGRREALVRLVSAAAREVRLALDAQTRTVRFEIPMAARHPGYDVFLRDAAGREIWRAEELVLSKVGRLAFAVPAGLLSTDDYVLALQGEALRGQEPPPAVVIKIRVHRN